MIITIKWLIIYPFSYLSDQKTTEGCMVVASPNIWVFNHADIHLVPLLQLQEHCVSSIICEVRVWLVIMGRDNQLVVLVHRQYCPMLSSSMIEDGKVINTCNRCSEDTCGNKSCFCCWHWELTTKFEWVKWNVSVFPLFSCSCYLLILFMRKGILLKCWS